MLFCCAFFVLRVEFSQALALALCAGGFGFFGRAAKRFSVFCGDARVVRLDFDAAAARFFCCHSLKFRGAEQLKRWFQIRFAREIEKS